ncbi:hypothetical protein RDI58_007540 [Solanum bulbocastanum]|uniref:C2H2-type domain-containing protein n=1 Tax=Solanum bulbocastanum TaxID=147425 RepID=A0AAN8U158_SOLBU
MKISSGKREHHNYICRFCKKVLRCAQALGGHMNIHRRDRARLKQLPSINEADSQNQSNSTLPAYMEHQNQSIIRPSDEKEDFNLLDDDECCVETSLSASKRQKSTIVCYDFIRSEALKIKRKSMEDIDLELRLGSASCPPRLSPLAT